MGKLKPVEAPPAISPKVINPKVKRWKETHIAEVRAKADNKDAREDVKDTLLAAGLMFANTPTGTVAMHDRAGATKIDWESYARKLASESKRWESLARSHLGEDTIEQAIAAPAPSAADEIEKALPAYTSVGEPTIELAAPKEWGIEAKAKKA